MFVTIGSNTFGRFDYDDLRISKQIKIARQIGASVSEPEVELDEPPEKTSPFGSTNQKQGADANIHIFLTFSLVSRLACTSSSLNNNNGSVQCCWNRNDSHRVVECECEFKTLNKMP